MTTTVTIKTADHPARVNMEHENEHEEENSRIYSQTSAVQFVPANTEVSFCLTKGSSIYATELPKGTKSLKDHDAGRFSAFAPVNTVTEVGAVHDEVG